MKISGNTFKKEERLKSRKIINELFEKGKIIHHNPFKVLYKEETDRNKVFPAQIAISVSKKSFKKAVERNYIKRKIREAYRVNKHLLYDNLSKNNQNLYLFVIYTAMNDNDFVFIEQEMKNLLRKLISKL